jgi:hypothetical protein
MAPVKDGLFEGTRNASEDMLKHSVVGLFSRANILWQINISDCLVMRGTR